MAHAVSINVASCVSHRLLGYHAYGGTAVHSGIIGEMGIFDHTDTRILRVLLREIADKGHSVMSA